jgi:metallo-beta-lactamase class B
MKSLLLAIFCSAFLTLATLGQTSNDIKIGVDSVEPFRIAGNIYYVGSADATSYLIVTPKGNILLDTGMKELVPQVVSNIAKLGFKLEDTKFILNSHAHFDHAGGIAEMRRLTKAKFLASELDAALLGRGGLDDPNFGDQFPFEKTIPDATFQNGKKISLGGTTLIANVTSGHTKGCTTWTTTVRDAGKDLNVIFVCSVSAPGYKLVGNEKYPEIVADYRRSFAWFRKQPVDIFLGSHAGFFNLEAKRKELRDNIKRNPFVDPDGYRQYIENNAKAFEERLKPSN